MIFNINIRYILFICFTLLSTVPVAILATWVERSAMEFEIRAVTDKHLLVARNITTALSRYVADTESVFRLVAENTVAGKPIQGARKLLHSLHFKHVCIADKPIG